MLMMDNLPALEREYERKKQSYAEKTGAMKSTLALLKKKYGVETAEDAKTLHEKRLKKTHKMMDEDIKESEAFKKEFDGLLGEN